MLPIPIIIVTFRNADDVIECLQSLSKASPEPAFDVYICENGGKEAFAELCARACAAEGPCVRADLGPPCRSEGFASVEGFGLKSSTARVFVGDAGDNLGYGGGVNRWLAPLREAGDWPGVLILNPDSMVETDSLGALARYARDHGKGMVTGRIARAADPGRIHTRGLRWRRMMANTQGVGIDEPVGSRPPPETIENRLDAPSGALVYVTRACLEKIGLMDEKYFLYFEDLDWGLRAKRQGGIGYAFDSLVYHKGGTTIGTGVSEFAAYLGFRNRLLFVHHCFPSWFAWTAIMSVAWALHLGARGRTANMRAALRGIVDGLLLRSGRPDEALRRHLMSRAEE